MSQILRPFVNTLTPVEKYFLSDKENLRQPIQIKLSKKLKICSQFFMAFLKSTFNFEHLENKDESYSLRFSKNVDWKIRADLNVYGATF